VRVPRVLLGESIEHTQHVSEQAAVINAMHRRVSGQSARQKRAAASGGC
jgi:hypothetical protein